MHRLIAIIIASLLALTSVSAKEYKVSGPQGGISFKLSLPDKFDTATDNCHLVILMHGIFSSKDFPPMPQIAKALASMTAGNERISPKSLILLAPGAVIKEDTQGGHFFGNSFDPANPPEYIRCFHHFKLGRDYLVQTQSLDIYGVSAGYKGPVCIIHGSKDGIVPLWCSEKITSL